MATPNAPANVSNLTKARKAKKPPSAARVTAEGVLATAAKQLEAAKSPQEKTLAESRVKEARDALKSLKFTEIGAARIRRAIGVMRQLENVANPNTYKWTKEQADKASEALTSAVRKVVAKLQNEKAKDASFTF